MISTLLPDHATESYNSETENKINKKTLESKKPPMEYSKHYSF
ncbi:MAG TPA: hypothetical protein VFS97_07250 [Nitrososphaeraceae archaeon]|nr:hypothetical protein [Nitrososphaeraceae archaeon]